MAFWYRRRARLNLAGDRILNTVFLEIIVPKDIPKDEIDQKKETEDEIGVAEQLFTTLSHEPKKIFSGFFRGFDTISFEIVSVDKKISFYINCPKRLRDLVEKQVHAQYPEAQIDRVRPPSLAKAAKSIAAFELGAQKNFVYPLKTYKQMESDPLNSLTNSLSKLGAGEAGAIQLIISPAGSSWRRKAAQKARAIMKGESIGATDNRVLKILSFVGKAAGELLGGLMSSGARKNDPFKANRSELEQAKKLTPMQEEAVKRLEEKASKTGYEANVRVIVAGQSEGDASSHMRNILSSFMQYSLSPFNGLRVKRKAKGRVMRDFVFRAFDPGLFKKMILNTEELASLFHLPTPKLETPNIKWLESKRAPAPTNLPATGLLLGINNYRGVRTEIRIGDADRRRHMYIIGRTGTGKSELMKNMAMQDIAGGRGLAVIDPHGDLVEDLLNFIPKNRADDVVLFEPFDLMRPMGLNMLEAERAEEKDFAVQEMIAIFYKLFPPEMIGPMFEHNMRNAMLTLMADKTEPGTIAEIPRIFTDQSFQRYKVSRVSDPVVRSFWEQEMAKTSDFHKSEMLGYIISKVGRFVENEMMRNIIGQSRSAFKFREIMDRGQILLINLSKGKTGEVNSKLLGLIIVSKIQMAALSRAGQPEDARKDFYLYIDEFQNFITDSIATILSEARKYKLNLIMAHQYVGQLVEGSDTRIRDAVFGNTGSLLAFRIGVEDAEVVAKEFAPVFNEYDLVNISRFNAYAKLMVGGTASRPFNLETPPPPADGSPGAARASAQLSKLKYGRPKDEVEREILKRARLGNFSAPAAGVERTM